MPQVHTSSRTRRLGFALAVNVALVALQAGYGLTAHSTGLLADAGHNLTDVAAIAASMAAVRYALRPTSPERSFGNHRGAILAALTNAALIALVTAAIAYEAVRRLLHPHPVHGAVVAVVAAGALVVNGAAALALHRGHADDLNMRAAALHMAGDALASFVVLGAGVILVVDHTVTWVDPVASLAVGLVILAETVPLLRSSVEILLESTPADIELDLVIAAMSEVPGVAEVHDLHVWSLSSDVRALSAHVMVAGHPTLEDAQAVGEQVKTAIGGPFGIAHATLELECERCVDGDLDGCLMEVERPAPSRADRRP